MKVTKLLNKGNSPKTIDLSTRLWGITTVCGVYSPERHAKCGVEIKHIEICIFLGILADTAADQMSVGSNHPCCPQLLADRWPVEHTAVPLLVDC